MPPRTIDNLGVDISTRWARDQEIDTSLTKESSAVSTQTEIDVTMPAFPSEFDLIFGNLYRQITWAGFYPPPKFNEQKKRFFSFQIIPSLGSDDSREAQMQRIQTVAPLKAEEKEDRERKKLAWEEEREEEEQKKERKILLTLFNSLHLLDRYLIDINSRRTQYQKG